MNKHEPNVPQRPTSDAAATDAEQASTPAGITEDLEEMAEKTGATVNHDDVDLVDDMVDDDNAFSG